MQILEGDITQGDPGGKAASKPGERPQMSAKDSPSIILGINHVEERRTGVEERTVYYGPCSDCESMAWLSRKDEDRLICGSCWYGPQWEGQDPILDDIMAHLRSTYREALGDVELYPEEEVFQTLTPEVHEDVDEVVCSVCLESVPQVAHTGMNIWRCPDCLERHAEDVVSGLRKIANSVPEEVLEEVSDHE